MTIRSNPPGAVVYVDDYAIGTTPVSANFTYYGTRKIRLVKDGYETLTLLQPVPTTWYEIPGIDFFSENVVPGKLVDRRTFEYTLVPQVIVPTEQLMERAECLRGQTHASGVVQATANPRPAPPEMLPAPTGQPGAGPMVPSGSPQQGWQAPSVPATGAAPLGPVPYPSQGPPSY
jgi:hypothetical protein